jgi:hypothetical protein
MFYLITRVSDQKRAAKILSKKQMLAKTSPPTPASHRAAPDSPAKVSKPG